MNERTLRKPSIFFPLTLLPSSSHRESSTSSAPADTIEFVITAAPLAKLFEFEEVEVVVLILTLVVVVCDGYGSVAERSTVAVVIALLAVDPRLLGRSIYGRGEEAKEDILFDVLIVKRLPSS
ncbi:unnamed protein product [Hymenolepis diminuta]|uniref:Uncharacterized protein n=1 Tax=Hymenolepis diminuta TaxID=6216 RepID=A0A0R3SF73_HYMDI|nr:unnamed protein product [Hymenolepis diminuta]